MDLNKASRLVKDHVNSDINVVDITPLRGGMVNRVEKWTTDGEPRSIVAKISSGSGDRSFQDEFSSMKYFSNNTDFPVPLPYACIPDCPEYSGSVLLMEYVGGSNLGEVRLTRQGSLKYERELAGILADLHTHKNDKYKSANSGHTYDRWLDIFAPRIEEEFHNAKGKLSSVTRGHIDTMLNNFDTCLPESGEPTLVHGDLWATNIMVNDSDPDDPHISAFVDGAAHFYEVEYELAYLLVFNTAGETFFDEYQKRMSIRTGFDDRCYVYWLNTMLRHVNRFSDSYIGPTERYAEEINRRFFQP